MNAISKTSLLAILFTASVAVAGLPSPDYPLNSKIVGQWLVMMNSLDELGKSDPELMQRTRDQKYQVNERNEATGQVSRGWDLEKIARDEPRIRSLIEKAGIKTADANRITVACIAAAMALTLKQQGISTGANQVPQANVDVVKPRHPEIMRLIGRMSQGAGERSQERDQQPRRE